MQPMIGLLYPAPQVASMAFEPAIAKDGSKNVAVFGFAWSKTATKSDRAQGARSFLAMLCRTMAKKCSVEGMAKPKATTIPATWTLLSTLPYPGGRRRQNFRLDVAKKGYAIGLDLAPRSFLATHERGCRWPRVLVVSKRQAARYDCVLRAYGAPSAIEPCPAGPAGRFAPPPRIWRP